jgi:hypothetical protein
MKILKVAQSMDEQLFPPLISDNDIAIFTETKENSYRGKIDFTSMSLDALYIWRQEHLPGGWDNLGGVTSSFEYWFSNVLKKTKEPDAVERLQGKPPKQSVKPSKGIDTFSDSV